MKKLEWLFLVVFFIYTCDDITEVEDISERTVTLVAPTNDAILSSGTIHFDWEPIEDAESYRIQIATPDFDAPLQIVADSTLADSTATNTTFSVSLNSGTYQWRVRAQNSDYHTNYTTQSFTVED
uniref:fibronectin type III domain-containing protein n=1 Tax=Gelidibacter sp. TaxID=2018083 RepID=UPI00404931EA